MVNILSFIVHAGLYNWHLYLQRWQRDMATGLYSLPRHTADCGKDHLLGDSEPVAIPEHNGVPDANTDPHTVDDAKPVCISDVDR